ncbi:FMRFamide receptor-like [Brachionus plicatilis]|uniref:FMRFamide receptor-like n=1 Tax=Brachionus plicatilis TaxID=10195 RepID=A0A3M7SE36_BRAPC|nr:FMRFamide receptor-like [Brachionus plicatilis]
MSYVAINLPYYLRVFALPCIIIFGFVLNVVSFFVTRKIRNLSITSHYMGSLGLIDSGVLLVGGVNMWVHTINPTFSFTLLSILNCKFVPFFFYTFADWSVFVIVIMTAERLYAVWKPLKAVKIDRKLQFKVTIIASACLSCFINSHFLFTHSVIKARREMLSDYENETEEYEPICIDTFWHEFYQSYWIYIDALIYSFVPFCLLSLFNILIVKYLFKAADESFQLLEENFVRRKKPRSNMIVPPNSLQHANRAVRFGSLRESVEIILSNGKKNKRITATINLLHPNRRLNRRIAFMLLTLNISFLVFSMPMVVMQIIYFTVPQFLDSGFEPRLHENVTTSFVIISEVPVNENTIAKFDLIKAIAELLQYLNHSTNFFLYSISGRTFRNETRRFFCKFFSCLGFLKRSKFQKSSKCSIRYSFKSF